MKNLLFLIGPTIMIYLGLVILQSVPITFLLFYGWLLGVPLLSRVKVHIHLTKKSFATGIVSGILFLLCIYGTIDILQESVFDMDAVQTLLVAWDFTGTKVIFLVLILIVINPILEEIYWRDFMYKRLTKQGTLYAVGIPSFFYALYHILSVYFIFSFPFNLIAVFPVFIAGIIWGYLRHIFNSIAAPVLSHMLADLGIMLVYFTFIAT